MPVSRFDLMDRLDMAIAQLLVKHQKVWRENQKRIQGDVIVFSVPSERGACSLYKYAHKYEKALSQELGYTIAIRHEVVADD